MIKSAFFHPQKTVSFCESSGRIGLFHPKSYVKSLIIPQDGSLSVIKTRSSPDSVYKTVGLLRILPDFLVKITVYLDWICEMFDLIGFHIEVIT